MYALFIDYYFLSGQWGRARIAHFKTPSDVGAWAKRAGFTKRPMFNVFRCEHSERYIVAFERSMERCETMLFHLNNLATMGADDYIMFTANAQHYDIRGWNASRWNIECRGRATGNGAQRLTALGACVPDTAQTVDGHTVSDSMPF